MKVNYKWPDALPNMLYPVTLFPARYQGTYEGGRWLAFACDPDEIDSDAWGDDISCNAFFKHNTIPYGTGDTAYDALDDLWSQLPVRQPGQEWADVP